MKPILFNTEMVKAIIDGRKTVTRRLVKNAPNNVYAGRCVLGAGLFDEATNMRVVEPTFKIGDILYVRETWQKVRVMKPQRAVPADFSEIHYYYRADGEIANSDDTPFLWRPSIHMPKEAARIFLKVKSVRVERLQSITEDQALAEGVPDDWPMDPVYCPVCKGDGLVGAVHPATLGYMEVDCPHCEKAVSRFANLWNSTIKPADLLTCGWEANPWCWVIEFERFEKPNKEE